MHAAGFSPIYPALMSLLIFGGSLEFIVVGMLLSSFYPLSVLVVSLLVQARHLFYGLSMLEKYKDLGWKKFYVIFGLCDESFAINYSTELPDNVDKGWFYFCVTALNHFYWVSGATIGALAGSYISLDLKGIGFVMTSMFVVIFAEQWLKERKRHYGVIGIFISLVSLVLFGADNFMIPAMICILLVLIPKRI